MTLFNDISSKWKLVIAILVCEIGGIASGFFSQSGVGTWFISLNKPSWNPPAYLFAPVWTLLYLLMGISFWLIWKSNATEPKKTNAMIIFGVQLFLNFWWSILFFKLHTPALALIDIILMFITINITIFWFAKISRTAAWLLVPYISWVSFASLLNYTIWIMN
ncbi:MAG: TspO/MBR family protein [Bacteroidota bacterium]